MWRQHYFTSAPISNVGNNFDSSEYIILSALKHRSSSHWDDHILVHAWQCWSGVCRLVCSTRHSETIQVGSSSCCKMYSTDAQYKINIRKTYRKERFVHRGRSRFNRQRTSMYINGSTMYYGCIAVIFIFDFSFGSSSNSIVQCIYMVVL